MLCSLSDHDMAGIIKKKAQRKYKPKTIRSRNFKNYDPVHLSSEINSIAWKPINSIDWKPFYSCKEPNSAKIMLKEIISMLCERQYTFYIKNNKRKAICPSLPVKISNEFPRQFTSEST